MTYIEITPIWWEQGGYYFLFSSFENNSDFAVQNKNVFVSTSQKFELIIFSFKNLGSFSSLTP